ncbi:MAG: DUF1289 domain-containing protein [Pseudomonadales bacterium]|nr:DUF1289 domain-containing protein [Pseudomonadales bacterium]
MAVKTPCVGLCSTTYGDLVCRGCKRFSHEIVNWNRYGDEEKRAVWARLVALRDQVLLSLLSVEDEALLEAQRQKHRIPDDTGGTPASRAYGLLRRGARHIRSLGAYGLAPAAEAEPWSAAELRDEIDRRFLALSEAHYERYLLREGRIHG